MATYKTPGVYVEELSLLPPSVAQVETAIPAFIGYTQKAKEYVNDDLLNVPTAISSMLEYELYFGGAPSVQVDTLDLDAQNQVATLVLADKYYMYESLRMFFANGGGDCYIVSVGYYGATVQNGNPTTPSTTPGLLVGLDAVKKFDRPTLFVIPDAALMSQANMSSLQTEVLMQCADLQDRFAIFDTQLPVQPNSFQDTIDAFRDGIGMNNLKYGAVYAPWILADLPRVVRYSDIKGNITQNGISVNLADLINDTAAKALANRLDNLVTDQGSVSTAVGLLTTNAFQNIQARYDDLVTKVKNASGNTAFRTALGNLFNYLRDTLDLINTQIGSGATSPLNDKSTPAGDTAYLFDFLKGKLNGTFADTINTVARLLAEANTNLTYTPALTLTGSTTGVDYTTTTSTENYFTTGTDNVSRFKNSISAFNTQWAILKSAVELISTSSVSFTSTIETAAKDAIPALKNMLQAIASEALTLPPSGAVAGAYAAVDRTRGVWKAPANLSLNKVIGVTDLIDNRDQENLNVDVVAGKSVNAIRPFTGKGTLVWGARTLAGNDNEWRYVNVRRFFIMAEESIRKATDQFVFEANDANTWVRVRSMIENFLTLQWRAGALAGAKPEHAFFVRVGLGSTMTAQDILEGRMNVEVGMAVVRPAEFIILKFSHKMQES